MDVEHVGAITVFYLASQRPVLGPQKMANADVEPAITTPARACSQMHPKQTKAGDLHRVQ